MVTIARNGPQWRAHMECDMCRIAKIEQVHPHSKPWVAVESTIKTTARTLGWKVGAESATCGACGRQK